jgi:uncharacterized protein
VPHTIAEAFALLGVGLAAGTINTVVGSGTLITFPTLLAFGYPPVLANVSNNVGLVPGVLSGVHGYRAELHGQRERATVLGAASVCGGLVGAILLLVLPASAFKAIVPALIGVALVLVVVQPWLASWVGARRRRRCSGQAGLREPGTGVGPVLWLLVFCTGVYGGYFGAAQGVLVIGLLGTFLDEPMQRINGAKNVLVGFVNGVAAIVYIIFAHVSWIVVLLIAAGSTLGGLIGARVGRRLPAIALRIFIVVIGVVSIVKLIFF